MEEDKGQYKWPLGENNICKKGNSNILPFDFIWIVIGCGQSRVDTAFLWGHHSISFWILTKLIIRSFLKRVYYIPMLKAKHFVNDLVHDDILFLLMLLLDGMKGTLSVTALRGSELSESRSTLSGNLYEFCRFSSCSTLIYALANCRFKLPVEQCKCYLHSYIIE